MKNRYDVKSERYGHTHSFVRMSDGRYVFVPEESWMPVYVTANEDGGVKFIDTEGGPCIGVGFKTDEIEVVKIDRDEKGEWFTLKEIFDGTHIPLK